MKHKLLSAIAAITVASATIISNVSAVTIGSDGSGTTNNSSTITVTRQVSNVSNPVSNTFSYSITANDNYEDSVTGAPTISDVVFNNVTPVDGTASATSTINFSGVAFDALGNYSYTVTETGSTDAVNYPLSTQKYTVTAYVRNVLSEGVPTGEYEVTLQVTDAGGDKQSDGLTFTSTATRTYITLSNSVAGNLADINKCFAYQIDITGVGGTDAFTVNTTSSCANNTNTITSGGVVYLKHGESATIGDADGKYELPVGVNFTITKQGDTDYTTYFNGADSGATSITATTLAVDADDFKTNNIITIVNSKIDSPLTGVILNIWPYVLLAILGAAGFMIAKARKNDI